VPRVPLNLPLSLFRGATPTRAEIFLELKVPSSGKDARSLLPAYRSGREVIGPTPLKLWRIASLSAGQAGFSLHMGEPLIRLEISLSIFFSSLLSQEI